MLARGAPFARLGSALAAVALALAGCGDDGDPRRPSAVDAQVSDDVSTVVKVRWQTEQPSIGYVEYGLTDALEHSTPLETKETQEHALDLLGLKPDREYRYRVVTWDGDDASASEIATIRTGDLPVGMPRLELEGSGHDQLTLVPVLGRTRAVLVIDADGDIVWYHSDDRKLDFYRVRLARDGKSLLYNAGSVSGDPADDSELVRVSLDGSKTKGIAVPLLAHDFVEHADGTLAAIVVEYRDFEGQRLRGDKIVEVSADGELTTVWSAWDCFDPAQWPGDDIANGKWTFANALDYDEKEQAYYLGMRNFSSIAKIDRKSGECEWVLGLSAPTLKFAPGSARFLHQHQFELRGDHLLVMDNDGNGGKQSRVIEYELDLENGIATEIWSYRADPKVYTFVLGEPVRMDDGSTFINWSAAGQMERVSADGESLWKLNSGAGFAFGFHTSAPTLYPRDARTP